MVSDPASSGISIESAPPVLRIQIQRPERRNAIHGASFDRLAEAFEAAMSNDDLRVIQLTAEGEHFCAGADLEISNAPSSTRPRTGHMVRGLGRGAHRMIRAMHECPVPIVAGVRGFAAGVGCNLALAADFVIASENAQFVEPFVERGLTPDSGSSWILPRLVGLARARRMLLLGEPISGEEAEAWGMIHQVVPDAQMDHAVVQLVARLASAASLSVGLAKSLIHRGLSSSLAEALENEAYSEELAIRSKDFKEGLKAFRERRKPKFEGL